MRTVLAIVTLATAYATVRYNVFKGVPWETWPTYVLNKAAALSAVGLILAEVIRRRRGRLGRPEVVGAARTLAWIHVLLSLALLGPGTYEAYFDAGRLTATAALAILAGALGAAAWQSWGRRWGKHGGAAVATMGLAGFLAGLHGALFGFAGWWEPGTWPGGMPPITLLAFLLGAAAAVATLSRRSRREGR